MDISDASRGQVIDEAAEVYEQFFVPALFGRWAVPLLDAAGVGSGDRLLDIGCGTGVVARAARERIGAAGAVTGVDRNEAMLAVARRIEPAVDWQHGVAERLRFADGAFDRVTAAFMLMFVDDRSAAVGEMARVVRPGGTVALATWAAIEESPGYAAMRALLSRVLGEEAAAALDPPFALGTIDAVGELLAPEFGRVDVARREGIARFGSIEEWLRTDIRGWTLADAVDDETFDRLVTDGRSALASFAGPSGRVEFAAPAIIAMAHR
jgi:SAM-dependent methyltransferase